MIRLTANNIELDLPTRTSVTIQGFNPAFDDDGTARSFSFPFRIEASGNNLRALGHANRLDTDNDDVEVPASLMIDNCWFYGILEVGERTDATIEVTFKSLSQGLLAKAEKFLLSEILATIDIPQTLQRIWTIEYKTIDPGNPSFVVERVAVINGVTFGGFNFTLASLINAINAVYPGVASSVGVDTMQLLPGATNPFLVTEVRNITTVTYRNIAFAQHDNFLAYLDAQVAAPAASHAFPVVYAPGFYGNNANWRGYLNYRHNTAKPRNIAEKTKIWRNTCVPFVRVRHILEAMSSALGVSIWSGFFSSPTFLKLLVWNNYALDQIVEDEFLPVGDEKYLQAYKKQIDLNQHVPAISGRAFLSAMSSFFNIYYEKTGNSVTGKLKRTQLENVPIDWSDKVAPGYAFDVKKRGGAEMRFPKAAETDTTTVAGQLENYISLLPGTNKIDVPFRPLNDNSSTDPLLGSNWKHAYTAAKGTSDEAEKSDPGLRLLFDLGFQPDSAGVNYWQSGRNRLNHQGAEIAEFDLDWPGEKGLYETFWRGWAEMLANSPTIQIPLRLESHEIDEMQQWNNPLRYFRTPKGAIKVIIKSFEFRRSLSGGKAETTIECLRL